MSEEIQEAEPEVEAPVEESVEEATPDKSETQQLAEEMKLMRDHLQLLSKRQQPPPPQENTYDDPVDRLALEQKRLQIQLAEARMMAKHKDFEEVITKYLPEAIKEEPSIASWLTETDYEKAYHLAKKSDAYLRDKAFKPKAKEAKESKIGSLSGMGSATAGTSEPNFLTMTNEEFLNYKRARNIN